MNKEIKNRMKAFTLIELLVVIMIIGLLLAILSPSIIKSLKFTRTAICGSNLRRIGDAVVLFRENKSSNLMPAVWQGLLGPYLDDNLDIFVCPEFAADDEGATEIALTDVVNFRVRHGGRDDYVELREGPYMVKLSDTQFNAARAAGYLNNSGFANNFPRGDWPYAADPDGVYWLCMEDYGGDWDYKDVMTQVRDNHDGTINLHMFSGFTCHANSLMWKYNDSEAQYIGSDNNVGIDIPVPIGEYRNSYGMNGDVKNTRYSSMKVLAVDYIWIIARADHDWTVYPGPTPGIPVFARHMNRMNVLFNGGEVVLMRPEEIDPQDPLIQDYYWSP